MKNTILSNYYLIIIFVIAIIKICFSLFIPINLILTAPHDDSLFLSQAYSLSNLEWLGNYSNLTMIKGPIFPIFLSTSLTFNIPLRIFESLLIIGSSLLFLKALNYFEFNKKIKIFIFILLIFFPIVYSSIEYRLLRDMIYPWLLLLIISQVIIILGSTLKNLNYSFKNKLFDSFFLGFFSFLFFLTREEGIWILPLLFVYLLIIIFITISKKNYILFFLLVFPVFVFIILKLSIGSMNNFYYDTFTIVDFKNPKYVKGYSSILRVEKDITTNYDGPSIHTWDEIFNVSISSRALKSAVSGQSYSAWKKMGCRAIIDQRPYLRGYDCTNNMVSAYFIFALRDVLWESGFRDPNSIYTFMEKIGDEIDEACDNGLIKCSKKIENILPPVTFKLSSLYEGFRSFPNALNILIRSSYGDINNFYSSGSVDNLYKNARDLNIKLLPTINSLNNPSNFYFYDKNKLNYSLKINDYFYKFYNFISHYWQFIIILGLLFSLYMKLYFNVLFILVLSGLVASRALMVSILNTTAMAPIAPIYLGSGTLVFYICLIFSFFCVINTLLKK